MNRHKFIFLFGLLLLVGGFLLLTVYLRTNASVVTVTPNVTAMASQKHSPAVIEGEPVRLQIPSLKLDLKIIPGYYDVASGKWTLTKDKVQYAAISPEPNNESGDTFLYGHYRKQVFASLHTIPAGASAVITTGNGHHFHYRLTKIRVVKPEQSDSIFKYQGKKPILTIQTCSGFFYQNRQLFTFDFVKVD